ncbi:glycoside hydrolase family 3 N-terminal domain-containing protein [Fibrobacter sp.]|uniref:glycoside hydrolase family 3 N-terminal domain-containing protein n=1 Tax=Fibrobacter sp. TaxID=35828 RepID=UPI00388D2AE8
MHLKRAVTIFLAAFAFVQAEDSLPDYRFVPLNSLTESIEVETPYGLPRELLPLWDSLSIKQKAAQMVMVYMTPASFMLEHEFGGYLVMKNHLKNLDKFTENIRTVNDSMRIKPLVAADQEGGLVNRISVISPKWEHTPSAKQMRTMSEDSIRALAQRIGAVLDSVGINLNLAPVLDPAKDSHGKHSFMEESKRSWGEDTTNAPKVRAFVQGMRESNVACVSKHFPGYDSWTNSDHQIAVSSTPKAKVAKNVEFFRTLSSDIPVTMMSSVSFVRISSRPAVFEPKIVKMARDMSPETVILTDDLWGVSLRAWVSGNERVRSKNYPAKDFRKLVRTALMAGNDMFMITYPQKAVEMVNYLAALSKQSKYYRERIEESSARILKMKYKAGLIK